VIDCEPTLAAREETVARVIAETGAVLVHPYDDARVVAGQGTAALELLDEVPDLDAVVMPVGGGGLMTGTAIVVRALRGRDVRVVAAEPAAADDAYRSFRSGTLVPSADPTTVADGLRTSLGAHGFAAITTLVDDVVRVGEDDILAAMRLFTQRTKLVIEPSSAVPVAAVLARAVRGARIGVILTGGNVAA
jgi:threonine dehydratase/serine racemase